MVKKVRIMEVKKVLEAVAGICLLVAGITSGQHFITAAGIAEMAKIVSE